MSIYDINPWVLLVGLISIMFGRHRIKHLFQEVWKKLLEDSTGDFGC